MARTLNISLPASRTASFVDDLRRHPGVIGITVQPGSSIVPPGDVVTVQISTREYFSLMQLLDRHQIGRGAGTSVSATKPEWIASPEAAPVVGSDPSIAVWEEMEAMLAKESHFNGTTAGLMFVGGFCAAAGIASGSVHVVAGAMAIAPGFEPFVRVAMGAVAGSDAWRRGAAAIVAGYACLLLGAFTSAVLLKLSGVSLLGGTEGYQSTQGLVHYWTTISFPAVAVSAVAAYAGTLLLFSHRSVLTAGVMLALALVPSASLVPLALVGSDPGRAAMALVRWTIDAGLVFVIALGTMGWRRRYHDRRRMMI